VILSDTDLVEYLRSGRLVVEPLDWEIVRENGLDLRLGSGFCEVLQTDEVLTVGEGDVSSYYRCSEVGDYLLLKPSTHYLLHTLETVALPSDLMGFVELRSTFARLGFMMPPTIVDAGFRGQLTVEVLTPPYPTRVRVGTRFLHVVFAKTLSPVANTYRGRYQNQRGVTPPRW
jgi:dCTP deaminase